MCSKDSPQTTYEIFHKHSINLQDFYLFYLCFVGNNSKSSKRRKKGRRRDKTKKNSENRRKPTKTGKTQQTRERPPCQQCGTVRPCHMARPCRPPQFVSRSVLFKALFGGSRGAQLGRISGDF